MSQTYNNIECILVDDCGTDQSATIAQEMISGYYGSIKFQILHHEKNSGLSAARNTGIREAKGEYLYFLDSDDTITADCIESMMTLAEKYNYPELVLSSIFSESPTHNWLHLDNYDFPEHTNDRKWIDEYWFNIPSTACNKLISKNLVIANKLFFIEGLVHEDNAWWLDMFHKVGNIAFHKKGTYKYRLNENSIMHVSYRDKSFLSMLRIADRYFLKNPFTNNKKAYWTLINQLLINKRNIPSVALKDRKNITSEYRTFVFRHVFNHKMPFGYSLIILMMILPPRLISFGIFRRICKKPQHIL